MVDPLQQDANFPDLEWVLQQIEPRSPFGEEYKKRIKPYPPGTEDLLRRELEDTGTYVQWLKSGEEKGDGQVLGDLLSHALDVRGSISFAMRGGILSEVELFEIKNLLFLFKNIEEFCREQHVPLLEKTCIRRYEDLESLLNPEGQNTDSFYLYDDYSERLRSLRQKRSDTENRRRRSLRELKRQVEEQYKVTLTGEFRLHLSSEDHELIEKIRKDDRFLFESESYNTQTFLLKIPKEISLLEEERDHWKEKEEEEEEKIRRKLSEKIKARGKDLFGTIHRLANLDLYLAKARYALSIQGVAPKITEEKGISIVEGRHPKVERVLEEKGLNFQKISISLEPGVTCITGANMGGKTISLKMTGLLTMMGQRGLFVPAKEMTMSLPHYVITSIGDRQSGDTGLSTFGGEIAHVVEAMGYGEESGLILIDELARGTNPMEGYAITLSIVRYLQNKPAMTLLTTHFDRITELEGVRHLQVVGLRNFDFQRVQASTVEDTLKMLNRIMDYRLLEKSGTTEVPKDAIEIARIMGLPEEVAAFAEETVKNGW